MKSLENCKSINILRRVALLCILERSGLMRLINISHELFWDGIKRLFLFVLKCVLVRDQSGADQPHCPVRMCGEHTQTHTHTHTHTHVGFYGLREISIGVMVFILYKLYVLLPYTYPTPKLSPHRRWCISIFPQKNSLCMIYKRFKLWGH